MELIYYIAAALLTFLVTVLILKKLIPFLKSKKLGQPILEIGPRWHKSKEGTPTMGGASFIIASVITGAVFSVLFGIMYSFEKVLPFIITLLYGVFCGAVGFIDDRAKLKNRQNDAGLTPKQKLALQFLGAALYVAALALFCRISTVLYIPFFNVSFDLKFAYYVIAVILLAGVDNSVNLNDGIDGLCSSITFVVALFFAAASFIFLKEENNVSLKLLACVTGGSAAGFLVYNFYPARVFMGDTGSLFFGALVAGGAFIMGNPLLVIIYGFVYIFETISVVLQVGYFKLTHGKRLFKMAPIHHHFEKCGFSEIKIVILFTTVTLVLCAAAVFGLKTV